MFAAGVWRNGKEIARSEGAEEAVLLFREPYEAGDLLRFEAECRRVCVRVDQQIAPARLYLPQMSFSYRIPLEGDNPLVYPPGTFPGTCHLISIRKDEGSEYRNLAENPADQRGGTDAYPRKPVCRQKRHRRHPCRIPPRPLALRELGDRRKGGRMPDAGFRKRSGIGLRGAVSAGGFSA